MKYKNAQESVQIAIKVWSNLAQTGSDVKYSAYDDLQLSRDYCNCPLCEFVSSQTTIGNLNCNKCPAIMFWTPNINEVGDIQYICERYAESPYTQWRQAKTIAARKYHAGKMVNLLQRVLSTEPTNVQE